MAAARPIRLARRSALVAALAAALLVGGTAVAAAAPSSPPPSPGPAAGPSGSPSGAPSGSPSGTPGATPKATAKSHANRSPVVCVRSGDGHLLDCPKSLPRSKRPAGAKRTTRVKDPVKDPASLVDARTWTSGGGNTFPGAIAPFGMTQWSPDTSPNRAAGGGYNFGDTKILGYSLTHVSGPGCGAGEDIPMLPMTGALPSGDPNDVTTAFSNDNEVAQAGYYSAESNQPQTITSEFTATPHSSMARFTYPSGQPAGFLIKLQDSQNGQFAPSTATVVNDHEVSGSETSGHFCGEDVNSGQEQVYTVHFDITFDQPFTARTIAGDNGPDAVYLTFGSTSVQAKLGISYVSDANAKQNWQTENPNWNFAAIRAATQKAWNDILGRIQISGGDYAHTQMFYSLLYKDFVQPNITSDVNGQFMGAGQKPDTIAKTQHDQYGMYSGWDTYHSLAQLQAMLDPSAASDQAQSQLNYYAEDKLLQQWGYLQDNNYVMVGDPMQSIIADYYAFGAKSFDLKTALKDMLEQANTTNDVRPGQNLEDALGYLPEDGSYRSCCNPHGFVSSLLEYDSNDLALSRFAAALGDRKDSLALEQRANNWENVFNPANDLLNPRNTDGTWVPGITKTTTDHYVEGDAYEYLWNTPNNYAALFSLLGGNKKVAQELRTFLSQPNGYGEFAQLTNEFGFGEQYAGDYAGDPAGTQMAVNTIRNTMYQPGPSLDNNDDLGANSSTFIWEMLGMYPENSGGDSLVFNGPGFPHASIKLPNGRTISINAPGASSTNFYVQGLKLNGRSYHKLYVPFSTLARGATLDWKLGTKPSTWGTSRKDAPPSYGAGTEPVVGFASDQQVTVAPGGSATVQIGAQNATTRRQKVRVGVQAPAAVSVQPTSARLDVPGDGRDTTKLTISAGPSTAPGFYAVPVSLSDRGGNLPKITLTVLVAAPGSLLRAFDNKGVSEDANPNGANFDGGGWSYSAEALAAQQVTPNGTLHVGDIDYTWPPSQPGQPDNAVAAGQQVTVNAPAGTRQLGFLGSASGGNGQGLATLTYTDGSTARYWLGFSDWTLGGGGGQVAFGNIDAVKTTYRNCNHCTGGRDNVDTHLFSDVLPADPTRTLASVTLPTGSTGGDLHVFSIGTSTAAQTGPVIDSVTPETVKAGDAVTIKGSGFGATQGKGYVHFADNGTDWGEPGNAAAFTVTSWSDTAITFTVPTPSGTDGQWHVAPGSTTMITVVDDAGHPSDTAALDIAASADPADYYDNTGISNDGDGSCDADYDGDGYSYSAQALAAAGASAGGTVTVDGIGYTWPDAPVCRPDNILAAGQKILVHGTAGATTLGFLGSSGNGSAGGPVTVTYTDGTSQTGQLYFGDWAQSASNGDLTALTMPYRNSQDGTSQQITMYVFADEIQLDPAKTVASVTLPMIAAQVGSGASTHIFAIGLK
jgi:predicted alpha-1,2-mannosidase